MPRQKDWTKTMEGGQLLAQGDVIQMMDKGVPVKCRVLSSLAMEDGSCLAGLEILEGERRGERFDTKLRACTPGARPEKE
jgi:hypothetical protein